MFEGKEQNKFGLFCVMEQMLTLLFLL